MFATYFPTPVIAQVPVRRALHRTLAVLAKLFEDSARRRAESELYGCQTRHLERLHELRRMCC